MPKICYRNQQESLNDHSLTEDGKARDGDDTQSSIKQQESLPEPTEISYPPRNGN